MKQNNLSIPASCALVGVLCLSAALQAQTVKKTAPPAKVTPPAAAKTPAVKSASTPAAGTAHTTGTATTKSTTGSTTTTGKAGTTTASAGGAKTTTGATTTGTQAKTTTTATGNTTSVHTGNTATGSTVRPTGGAAGAGGPGHGGPAASGSAHVGAMNHPAPVGSREMHGPSGEARMRANGRPMDVHDARRGMDIHHNLGGGRRVMVDRPGGGRMYYERGRPGYIGHPYMAHGYEYNRRSYYYHGRAYDRYYRPYGYHGYALDVYAPARYYPAGFYGWAYQPWATPVPYAWGFGAAAWYGVYGGYFTPYPVYATPSLWLTDYMISQSLAAAYQAQVEAGQAPGGPVQAQALSPEVKQMVATEVQRQIALENAEAAQNAQQQAPDPASSGIARLLSDGQPHVFVAGKEVDVVDASGQECAVTDGDVLQLTTPPGPQDTTANVVVLSSKGALDCKRSATVTIALDELQDMNNHMRETVDQGLQELQAKQGKGGLPPAPPSALAPPVNALVAENAPPPDPNGEKDLTAQAQASETAEKDVLASAGAGPAPPSTEVAAGPAPAAVVSISPGQTTDEVKGSLGEPLRKATMGPKTIYFYKDMKITFNNGKVTSID